MKYLVRKVLEVEIDSDDYAGWDHGKAEQRNVVEIAECVDDLFWDTASVDVIRL